MLRQTTKSAASNGTSLQGYIDISFAELVAKFGQPLLKGDTHDKVKAEWVLRDHPCGFVVTIYDYKSHCEPEYNRDWHIGGKGHTAVRLIQTEFPTHQVDFAGGR